MTQVPEFKTFTGCNSYSCQAGDIVSAQDERKQLFGLAIGCRLTNIAEYGKGGIVIKPTIVSELLSNGQSRSLNQTVGLGAPNTAAILGTVVERWR